MFSKSVNPLIILRNIAFFMFTLSLLSACGNNEDADKVKAIIDINTRNVTSLKISSPNIIIETGATEQFSAEGIVGNDDTNRIDVSDKVIWSSSDPSLASINQTGLMTSHVDGMVTITTRWGDLSDSKDIMLSSAPLNSITIEGNTTPVSVCTTDHQLTAKGNYADNTTRDISNIVTWSSADDTLLEINQNGRFTSLGNGTVNVTATRTSASDSVSGSTGITIDNDLTSISISATEDEVPVKGTLSFTATGTYSDSESSTRNITRIATWASDDTDVLSISNETGSKGVATGIAEGTANISASCNSTAAVNSALSAISVTPEIVINGVSINQDATNLEFKVIDSPEQLVARLKRSNGTFSTDITNDDDTIWRIERVISGTSLQLSNTRGSKGEIKFTAPGITEISVRYNDSDANIGPFEDRIEIEIIE